MPGEQTEKQRAENNSVAATEGKKGETYDRRPRGRNVHGGREETGNVK